MWHTCKRRQRGGLNTLNHNRQLDRQPYEEHIIDSDTSTQHNTIIPHYAIPPVWSTLAFSSTCTVPAVWPVVAPPSLPFQLSVLLSHCHSLAPVSIVQRAAVHTS